MLRQKYKDGKDFPRYDSEVQWRLRRRFGCRSLLSLEKRVSALRGRNQTRNINVSDAPMACLALISLAWSGPLFSLIGHRSHASQIHLSYFLESSELGFQHASAG